MLPAMEDRSFCRWQYAFMAQVLQHIDNKNSQKKDSHATQCNKKIETLTIFLNKG
jgi:hypothetical protein